jgi:hypothetical protein
MKIIYASFICETTMEATMMAVEFIVTATDGSEINKGPPEHSNAAPKIWSLHSLTTYN